jgi:hypothetical protein
MWCRKVSAIAPNYVHLNERSHSSSTTWSGSRIGGGLRGICLDQDRENYCHPSRSKYKALLSQGQTVFANRPSIFVDVTLFLLSVQQVEARGV